MKSHEISAREAGERLLSHDNILILTHRNPDGDTLGTASALCRVLLALGKQARFENSDEIPVKFRYLYEDLPQEDFTPEYIVAVDVADTTLLGERLSRYADSVDLCIDHHISNRRYAKELYLEAEDGAAALTLYRVLQTMDVALTPEIADDLYTGLSTDTGCFRYSNASADAYRAAADLIEAGADNAKINEAMFETSPVSYFKLLTEVLTGMRLFGDGLVCVFKVTQDMLKRTGATEDQCDAICALSRTMEGVQVGITMKQRPDGHYKFSVRTRDHVDGSVLCGHFGGGGHARAAGCDAEGDEEKQLQEMLALIGEQLGRTI